ncbi:hypothetical protein [Arthrobacter woluwensis]|uniref:hypothetical protein n=1 Tax=Arthrobacter woluwensis TaxID=156980 RepID=UPI001C976972|nr:hypothetical protein [Arthrobacter woluwensis]
MRVTSLQRIYRLKVTIMALVSLIMGVGLQILAAHAATVAPALAFLPLSEIGGTLFAAGLFGIAWDYFDGKDKEERENERIRAILEESAPAFRDAVVRGFAVENDDLKRVATPELLDQIAGNVLALRLGDREFAEEVYADVRDQAIRAPEHWHDVDVQIRLTPAGVRNAKGVPLFIVTARWEYTFIPSHATQRFACVSDKDEFRELVTDIPATAAWFMTPASGLDASAQDSFELVQYSVDGQERSIRRSARKTGQTYSVNIGEETVRAQLPVTVSFTYRTLTLRAGHMLHFDIDQPTKGLTVSLDYSDTDIAQVKVLDLIASSKHARIQRTPKSVPGRSVSVDFDGWVFPRTGIAFVWTLDSELQT